jgi:N,N'-diacetyllegionaminate synthase
VTQHEHAGKGQRVTDAPVCFLVPARGGSQRVPDKNLQHVAGIPLVGRAIRAARTAAAGIAGGPHAIVCSTDDQAIAEAARAWGAEVPFLRPATLADDSATSVAVALHALDRLESSGRRFRALVLLQPTSPLLDPADLIRAIHVFEAAGVSVTSVAESHPAAWHWESDDDGTLQPAASREDGRLLLAGAFYVISPTELRTKRRFVTPGHTLGARIPAFTAVDVDTTADLELARRLADAAPIQPVTVAGRSIGGGPCLVIAEAGVNHNGDLSIAHRLVDAAADAGADAVKFQTFDPDRLAAADAPLAGYQRTAGERDRGQREMLASLALPNEAWAALQAHSSDLGLVFLSSPFDEASADLLDRLDVPAFKVASGELTNHPFIAYLARKGRPLLVSTGMATMREVDEVLVAIAASGNPPVALFHCVSSYPADPADANLQAIRTLRAAFGVPVGWSDHTPGIAMPIAAVALGADLVEKHLTLDRSLPGPDQRASLEPSELAAMVAAIRDTEVARGSGEKAPAPAEREVALVARRSLHWAADLPAGTLVTPEHLVSLRPGTGISPARREAFIGRTLRWDAVAGAAVRPADVEESD